MKVAMILTSHDRLGDADKQTGFWLEELVVPYYTLHHTVVEITLVSPKGDQPPLDPKSDEPDAQTQDTERFRTDRAAGIGGDRQGRYAVGRGF